MKKPYIIEIFIWTIILFCIFSTGIFTYSKLFIEPNQYIIKFKDINGITEGSPVRLMGISIGYVKSLKKSDNNINVEILINKKNIKLPNGTIARIQAFGLGGSKSIELMPPDGSSDVGILIENTNSRITDTVDKVASFAKMLEAIEKYVKGLDTAGMERFLTTFEEMKTSKLEEVDTDINIFKTNLDKAAKNIKTKQNEVNDEIVKINQTVVKINNLIQNRK